MEVGLAEVKPFNRLMILLLLQLLRKYLLKQSNCKSKKEARFNARFKNH